MLTLATVNINGLDVLIVKSDGAYGGSIEIAPLDPEAPWTPEQIADAHGIADVWREASRQDPPRTPYIPTVTHVPERGAGVASLPQVKSWTPAPHPSTPRPPRTALKVEILSHLWSRSHGPTVASWSLLALLVFAAIGGRP